MRLRFLKVLLGFILIQACKRDAKSETELDPRVGSSTVMQSSDAEPGQTKVTDRNPSRPQNPKIILRGDETVTLERSSTVPGRSCQDKQGLSQGAPTKVIRFALKGSNLRLTRTTPSSCPPVTETSETSLNPEAVNQVKEKIQALRVWLYPVGSLCGSTSNYETLAVFDAGFFKDPQNLSQSFNPDSGSGAAPKAFYVFSMKSPEQICPGSYVTEDLNELFAFLSASFGS